MHSDARALPDGTTAQSDLCIIGAGAAGITIAQEYAGTATDVLLLEAGDFELESSTQSMYEGESTGLDTYPLHASRLRYFGGTTNHWAGWCGPLDPIDFENRPWVPRSGWPLSLDELEPYYQRAHPLCDLGPYNYNPDYWHTHSSGFPPLPFASSKIQTKVFQGSTPTRFGTKYKEEIVQSENLTLWTHANVTNIQTPENGSRVTELSVECLNGKSHRVRAQFYILACGGLENPRLLLASDDGNSNGVGNEHDLVGRHFMGHPNTYSSTLHLEKWPAPAYHETTDREVWGVFSLSPKQQRKHQVLNYTAVPEVDEFGTSLPSWAYSLPGLQGLEETSKYYFGAPPTFKLNDKVEQRPNPDSRVTLSSETDELGQPRISFHWALTEQEKRTIRIGTEILGQELGRLGLGRLHRREWIAPEHDGWPTHLRDGFHHMGTTRMSASPEKGVVDPDCKVHSVQNLYVAGSSVFPTSGTANPTLTLIALALRLSDHLKEKLRS